MDMFRQTSKTLRFVLAHAVFTHMTEGKSDFEKCMMGNIFSIRQSLVGDELNEHIRAGSAVRSEEHSFMFNEVFGVPSVGAEWKTSNLIDEATEWMLDNDLQCSFEVVDVTYEFDESGYTLPLITGFTVRGTGILSGMTKDFRGAK